MAQSVGEVALDIVAGRNTVNIVVRDAMNDVQNTVNRGSSRISNALGKIGGVASTVGKVTAVGIGVASTAIVGLGKQAVDAYAEYEQLVGGVETLFKESASTVITNASNAYKTAGMSANEYMTTVTSFSASLLQSLGNDTVKASEMANMAITDMSDNANKMGTSMEMIQNAYNGFAKQNYTMLDNLKLGYGGTKTEMERLLADAEKLSGIKYDISSYADVVDAIHVIQTEMGITGTTAKEASSTISGSIASMKSAWTNLLTGLTDESQDFDALINNFVDSVDAVGDNLIPRISSVLDGVANLVTKLAPKLVAKIPDILSSLLPAVVQGAVSLVNAVVDAMPMLIDVILSCLPALIEGMQSIFNSLTSALPSMMESLISALPSLIPILIDMAVSMIVSLMSNLSSIIQPIIDYLPDIIHSISDAVIRNLPILISGIVSLVVGIVRAIPQIISALVQSIPFIIESIIAGLLSCLPQLIEGLIKLNIELTLALPQIIASLLQSIPMVLVGIVSALIKGVPILVDGLVQMVESISGEYWGMVAPFATEISSFFTDVWNVVSDGVMTAWNAISNYFSTTFNNIKMATTYVFTEVKNKLTEIWTGVVTFITSILERIKNFVVETWGKISSFVGEAMNTIRNTVTNIWNNIKDATHNIFENIKNKIFDSVGNIKSTITNGFNSAFDVIKGIPAKAITWGKDMIQGIIDGIKSMIGKVGDAVTGVADKIRSILHFSVPDEGPLTDYETWMPDFMQGLASGIRGNMSLVTGAINDLAGQMAINPTMAINPPVLNSVKAGSSASVSADGESKLDRLISLMEQFIVSGNNDMTVPIYIGNELVDEYILNKNSRNTIRSGGRA